MRIAILDNSTSRWTASVSFTRMLTLSLQAASKEADVELGFLSKGGGLRGVDIPVWNLKSPSYFPGEYTLRKLAGRDRKTVLQASVTAHRVDVLLPLLDLQQALRNTATIGWIPDFQALHLPQFFGEEERKHHEGMVGRLCSNTTRLLLSSKDALGHLSGAAPDATQKARAIPFPSLFAFEPPPVSSRDICALYNLPPKFALVANQLWRHKNHQVVIEALRLLKDSGLKVPLVCTGLPLDHRDGANQPLSDLLQAIAKAGLGESVHVLGAVPFSDLVDLMRSAAVIIQPSRFEGWSTVVQDALALGRPVLCSDLAVHREQAPLALGFFGVDAPAVLAELLTSHWPSLSSGPCPSSETVALDKEIGFAREHGKQLFGLCRDAANSGR